jgi:hypothetical protein
MVTLPQIPAFSSSRVIPVALADLTPVANDVMEHFRLQGYEVTGEKTPSGGWHISLAKGTLFATALGLKTALNVELESTATATLVKAGIGVFGYRVIPALVARFIAWPVWLTQVWGLVQQARLDDEALDAAERSVHAHSTRVTPVERAAAGRPATYCTECGARLPDGARFCAACGSKVQ